MTDVTTTVLIADETGHTELSLTQDETMALPLVGSPHAWVFAGGTMMQPQQLQEADWGTIGTVRIVPSLVGGDY